MAKNKKTDDNNENISRQIKQETIHSAIAILFFVLSLLSVLASFGKAGLIGEYVFIFFKKLFGIGYFLFPILLIMFGVSFLKGAERKFKTTKIIASFVFFLSCLGIINLFPNSPGGIVGRLVSVPLIKLFDFYATIALLIALSAISLIITFETHFTLESLLFWKRFKKSPEEIEEENLLAKKRAEKESEERLDKRIKEINQNQKEDEEEAESDAEENSEKEKEAENKKRGKLKEMLSLSRDEEKRLDNMASFSRLGIPFNPPPLSLLEKDKGKPEVGDIKANANIIKRTLQNFGINVEMDEISIGPSVTRYSLKPAEGVKLSKIVALNNDLALALAAHPIRIEAPIPGKSLVGIEIPNTTKTTVGLGTLLGADEYQQSDKPLMVSLGKSITGDAHFSNLAKAPHMLIAGATGSGKSVTIHAVITSLLYRNSPENLRFIMIDPKRVELTLYNKIPHLLTPVITDPKNAILTLRWAAKEMARRYDILEKHSVRDIQSYHKNVLATAMKEAEEYVGDEEIEKPETMPYIVIVIDELADIMQTYPRELESAIVRLAQMSRAVGIHLILSTQRPSVNVITGLIKANIPTRIALQVSAQIDSRTILDTGGAEKLLGAGDMLYLGGEMSKPLRLQSAYISENEVKKVVKYFSDAYRDEIIDQINLTENNEAGSDATFNALGGSRGGLSDGDDLGGLDEENMYEPAKKIVLETGRASTSYIQRKLGIGYSRAAKILDMLEEHGIVGPANGSKPREVYGASDKGILNSSIDEIDNRELEEKNENIG